jgi:multisubunit Na+/H+ antiporter MnhG subunit
MDIEYKEDQKIMLDWIIDFYHQGYFRSIGMMSGGNVYNFGLGVWLFYALGFFAQTPVALTMLVSIINVISLWLLYFVIKRYIPKDEKETWYYSLCLLAVSILPIVLSRNIWIQSILPPFCFTILALYINRSTSILCSFSLGLMLVLIGQIHLSGFFLCIFMSLLILYYHFRKIVVIHLVSYFGGGTLAAIGMIPLFKFLMGQSYDFTKFKIGKPFGFSNNMVSHF